MRSSQTALEQKISRDSTETDARSFTSGKSASHSSVLERAREYNRRIDQRNQQRTKSLERQSNESNASSTLLTPRSQSAGRHTAGNRMSTRERAMASVRNETTTPAGGGSYRSRPDPVSTTPKSSASPRTHQRPDPTTPKSPSSRSARTKGSAKQPKQPDPKPQEAVVTPELLVDALSGHEDGLLAIAERLMEHYDSGYDVMGEAIIDAFADVQKLFQHVVEAAHMEGAAFEASRREGEMAELRKQVQNGEAVVPDDDTLPASPTSAAGPNRHDEFIDQDVKDVLTEAIRNGTSLRESHQHMECYKLYEAACQSASSLLPVDSDHRGRLQLSIARAESMSPDRACAILRYAMDDVLRSGLRAGKAPLPDISKRGDCVLSKPKDYPSLNGNAQAGVVQSSEEALASLVEEMKEVISAPVYEGTPLRIVAERFWVALAEAQKSQQKTDEGLEQSLAKLKGEYLLARAEWEEKLTASQEQADMYKAKYVVAKDTASTSGDVYMEQARVAAQRMRENRAANEDLNLNYDNIPSGRSRGPSSVASTVDGLKKHAQSIVGSFNCSGLNERTSGVLHSDTHDTASLSKQSTPGRDGIRDSKSFSSQSHGTTGTPNSRASSRGKQRRGRSRTKRETYSSQNPSSPARADI